MWQIMRSSRQYSLLLRALYGWLIMNQDEVETNVVQGGEKDGENKTREGGALG